MTDRDNKQQGRSAAVVIVLLLVAIPPSLYVLPVGPLMWLVDHDYLSHDNPFWIVYYRLALGAATRGVTPLLVGRLNCGVNRINV